MAAAKTAKEGDVIELAAGKFELGATLELKAKMTLKGAGIGKTTLTHAPGWKPSTKTLPDPETRFEGLDADAYLLRIQRDTGGATICDMTLQGPQLHGAIFGLAPADMHLFNLRINNFLYSGIRTLGMKRAKIHDCEFIDAGGRWDKGKSGLQGGLTGGAIFATWMGDCEIFDNRFRRENPSPEREFYGIKVRQSVGCHIHHNTIQTGFCLEFPFENDEDNEIDHNYLWYALSMPKYAGGSVPKSGVTFHIHHNYFRHSYAIEFARNGVEIDHNLFDFETTDDGGHLITGFGQADAKGPATFHNNLVSNPGRGVIWINEVYNHVEVRNNHIIARTTKTPRKDGLFGFNPKCDFKTIAIRDNIIQCEGEPRPLLRCKESYEAVVENNTLINVADADKLKNPKADRIVGLEKPLQFDCGAKGEFSVDGWKIGPSKK